MSPGSARFLLAACLMALAPQAVHAQVAVRGGTVHTMAGPAIQDGVVLVGADGRIERVGPASQTQVPSGYRVLEAAVVTPGLVDAHSVVGLAGYLNQPHDQDQLERSGAIQPELRAVDAYNAREDLVDWVRSFGVTTIHTGHGPGALMSGQTMIVKARGSTVDAATMVPVAMVAMTLGPEVAANFNNRPGTRAKGVALVRQELIRAQEYRDRRAAGSTGSGDSGSSGSPPGRDLRMEILGQVLDREIRALITANRASEILAALRLQREFGFDLVLDGAAEAYLVADEVRAAGVPVIVHPTMARHFGTMENATFEAVRRLLDAGIPVALQSGYEGYVPKTRVVLFEAAMAAAYGLSFDEALRTITIDAARIIGQDGRVGSIERGKDGDLVLFDGDPFEYVTRVCGVVIEGRVVREECR
jgi:imidazolonepropionase-like amidohydrolase